MSWLKLISISASVLVFICARKTNCAMVSSTTDNNCPAGRTCGVPEPPVVNIIETNRDEDDDDDEDDDSMGLNDFGGNSVYSGNYVCLGGTGSGKTTFIKSMTSATIGDLKRGGANNMQPGSCTTEMKDYHSMQYHLPSKLDPNTKLYTSFTMKDTVGFGAEDIQSKDIILDTLKTILKDVNRINAFILVHKAERKRLDHNDDLRIMRRLFELVEADMARHVIVVVTHTAAYSDAAKEEYSDALFKLLGAQPTFAAAAEAGANSTPPLPSCPPHLASCQAARAAQAAQNAQTARQAARPKRENIKRENIVHVNFANWKELNPYFRKFFKKTRQAEFLKVAHFLRTFDQPFNPLQYLFRKGQLLEDDNLINDFHG